MAEALARLRLLRLGVPLFLAWTAAWVLGISLLATVAIELRAELRDSDLDTELALYATAVYGLTWFDESGQLRDEVLTLEEELLDGPFDLWVVEPGEPAGVHLAPASPRFAVEDFADLAPAVIERQEDVYRDGRDRRGQPYRLHAIPTFDDREGQPARAMVVVVGDPEPGRAAHRTFVRGIVLAAVLLGVAGLLVGFGLTRWSLRPALESLHQRERFLAAAAHELRTPLAALRGVCDSALAGDEEGQVALGRMASLLGSASHTVEDLLVFARLDAGASLERRKVRLDLLAEATLPEDSTVQLEADESVVEVDPRLAAVAIRNLVENARTHGGEEDGSIGLRVAGAEVVVVDRGPGFPAELLRQPAPGVSVLPSQHGTGLGLNLVRRIAELHGGGLQLENRVRGGARAVLRFGG